MSSQAGCEGGCGVEGKQDLKTANMRGANVYIPPPFRADPHALGTTLLEGGEDDTGTTGMQEEVQPNFRTPPGRRAPDNPAYTPDNPAPRIIRPRPRLSGPSRVSLYRVRFILSRVRFGPVQSNQVESGRPALI